MSQKCRSNSVLVIGSVNIDQVYYLNHLPQKGETVSASFVSEGLGGKGANQAAAISKSGTYCYFCGIINESDNFVKKALADLKLDLTFLLETKERPTGKAIIQVEKKSGENFITLCPNSNYLFNDKIIDNVLKNIERNDYLVLQNEINNLDYIIESAHNKGARIILNTAPITDELVKDTKFQNLFMMIFNWSEFKHLIDKLKIVKNTKEDLKVEEIEEIMRIMGTSERFSQIEMFILTLGERGVAALYTDNKNTNKKSHRTFLFKQTRRIPNAYNIVDTTAAGDTFIGHFVSNFIRDPENIGVCIDLAMAASILCICKEGAMDSIPSKDDVHEFYKEHFE